jgi:hypothetical protein
MDGFFKEFSRLASRCHCVCLEIRSNESRSYWRRDFLRVCATRSGQGLLDSLELLLTQSSEELAAEKACFDALMDSTDLGAGQ